MCSIFLCAVYIFPAGTLNFKAVLPFGKLIKRRDMEINIIYSVYQAVTYILYPHCQRYQSLQAA